MGSQEECMVQLSGLATLMAASRMPMISRALVIFLSTSRMRQLSYSAI